MLSLADACLVRMAEWLPLSSERVLDKRPLLAQSVANLITLDQSIEGRQDEKHLRLAIANCAEFLSELTNQDWDPHVLMRWAQRLRAHARSQAGLEVQRRYALDFQQAVPIELWRQTSGPLFDWCQTEAAVWQDEVQHATSALNVSCAAPKRRAVSPRKPGSATASLFESAKASCPHAAEDRDLLALGKPFGIRMLTPVELLERAR